MNFVGVAAGLSDHPIDADQESRNIDREPLHVPWRRAGGLAYDDALWGEGENLRVGAQRIFRALRPHLHADETFDAASDPTRAMVGWAWSRAQPISGVPTAWVAATDIASVRWTRHPFISDTLASRTGAWRSSDRSWAVDRVELTLGFSASPGHPGRRDRRSARVAVPAIRRLVHPRRGGRGGRPRPPDRRVGR